jgi:hypothetical protein
MSLPPFLGNVIAFLLALMVPAALGCLVLAGLSLRAEGGINYQVGGSFLKYILWAAIFLTVQGVGRWFAGLGLGLNGISGNFGTGFLAPVVMVVTTFMKDVVLGHLIPVIAAALVLTALPPAGEQLALLQASATFRTLEGAEASVPEQWLTFVLDPADRVLLLQTRMIVGGCMRTYNAVLIWRLRRTRLEFLNLLIPFFDSTRPISNPLIRRKVCAFLLVLTHHRAPSSSNRACRANLLPILSFSRQTEKSLHLVPFVPTPCRCMMASSIARGLGLRTFLSKRSMRSSVGRETLSKDW